jgi:tetratricopeptide (TPR) repeat protein
VIGVWLWGVDGSSIKRRSSVNNQGEYDESVKYFDEAIRRDAINSTYWFDKGVALYYLERYDEALLAYDEALKLDSNNADIWYDKSIALDALGRNSESKQARNEAIRLDPNYADRSYHAGFFSMQLYQERHLLVPGELQ